LPGEMVTTISLKKVFVGTELTATQEGISDTSRNVLPGIAGIIGKIKKTGRAGNSGYVNL